MQGYSSLNYWQWRQRRLMSFELLPTSFFWLNIKYWERRRKLILCGERAPPNLYCSPNLGVLIFHCKNDIYVTYDTCRSIYFTTEISPQQDAMLTCAAGHMCITRDPCSPIILFRNLITLTWSNFSIR